MRDFARCDTIENGSRYGMSKSESKMKEKNARELYRSLASKPSHFDYGRMADRAEQARHLLNEIAALPGRRKVGSAEHAFWLDCIALFNRCVDEAYPSGFWDDFERLEQGDLAGLETAMKFLECDPWFFRSGYFKEKLISLIVKMPLTKVQSERLQEVVINAIMFRDRREFRKYANLARAVRTSEFELRIVELLNHEDEGVRRRAHWVLDTVRGQPSRPGQRYCCSEHSHTN